MWFYCLKNMAFRYFPLFLNLHAVHFDVKNDVLIILMLKIAAGHFDVKTCVCVFVFGLNKSTFGSQNFLHWIFISIKWSGSATDVKKQGLIITMSLLFSIKNICQNHLLEKPLMAMQLLAVCHLNNRSLVPVEIAVAEKVLGWSQFVGNKSKATAVHWD